MPATMSCAANTKEAWVGKSVEIVPSILFGVMGLSHILGRPFAGPL